MREERDHAAAIDWAPFHASHRGREPRPLLLAALDLTGPGAGRVAVELGCGDGADSRWLLGQGWRVTAVDAGETGLAMLREDAGDHPALTTVRATLEEFVPPSCDLLYASYVLPFCTPSAFPATWRRIRAALRAGGRLAVNLFGDRDSWAGEFDDVVFVTRDRARGLFEGLVVERFDEVDEDGPSGRGPKHWHEFQVVARRDPERAVLGGVARSQETTHHHAGGRPADHLVEAGALVEAARAEEHEVVVAALASGECWSHEW